MGANRTLHSSIMHCSITGSWWMGLFHMGEQNTKKEQEEAKSGILYMHIEMEDEAAKANTIWINSVEWKTLWHQELATAQIQHQAEIHSAPEKKVVKIWHYKRCKVEMQTQGDNIYRVDAWRCVKNVAIPLIWPECHHQLHWNTDMVLIKNAVSPCTGSYTRNEYQMWGVRNLDLVSNSPDY